MGVGADGVGSGLWTIPAKRCLSLMLSCITTGSSITIPPVSPLPRFPIPLPPVFPSLEIGVLMILASGIKPGDLDDGVSSLVTTYDLLATGLNWGQHRNLRRSDRRSRRSSKIRS